MRILKKNLFYGSSLLLSAALQTSPAIAGGNGVKVTETGSIYLLDLVEQGVEVAPIFHEDVPVDPEILRRTTVVFRGIPVPPSDLVAKKLSEINAVNKALAEEILHTMENTQWRVIAAGLVDLPDEDSVLKLGNYSLVQVAIRRLHSVSIARDHWQLMPEAHRAALLLHEAVLIALNFPSETTESPFEKTREIVGYFFTHGLVDKGMNGLRILLCGSDQPRNFVQKPCKLSL